MKSLWSLCFTTTPAVKYNFVIYILILGCDKLDIRATLKSCHFGFVVMFYMLYYDREEFEANPWVEFSRGSYMAFYGSYLSIFKKLRFGTLVGDGQKFHLPFSYQHPTIFSPEPTPTSVPLKL